MSKDRYHHAITRGAFYNLLGGVARLGYPAFLLVVTRLWGSAFGGLYLLAQALIEIVSCAVVEGPADATIVFASRHVEKAETDRSARERLYRVLATIVRVGLGLAVPVALASLLLGGPVVRHLFPHYRELYPGLLLLGCTLVPRALSQVAIAATKALLHMQYDALLNGLLYPILLLGGGVVAYLSGGRLTALLAVQLGAETALALLALGVFARFFSLRELLAATRLPLDREVVRFVIPQGLNLTFNRYIGRLDGIMLAAFGLSKTDLGFFSTAALLTGLLAQIRMVFSGALAPVAARYHGAGERAALEETMGRVARWSTQLVIPVVFAVIVFRADLLGLVSHDYHRTSSFVVIQLIPPFTSCAYGLAGACLMFTGHSRTTLGNSIVVALLNTVFMYALVPHHGTVGAALATAISSSLMTGLQMVELYRLEGVAIRWRDVKLPHWGLFLGLAPLVVFWDPARLSAFDRVAVTAVACLLYVAVLVVPARLRKTDRARSATIA